MNAWKFPVAASAALAVTMSGCLTSQTSSSANNDSNANSVGASVFVKTLTPSDQSAMNLATDALGNMSLAQGGMNEQTRDDLLSANATFRANLQQDPSNSAANFGLAVTSLALRTDELADTLDLMYKNGLSVGSVDPEGMFRSSPLAIAESPAVSARALAVPEKSATIRQLQDVVERRFMPTVDSLVNALQMCWNDPGFAYRFKIEGFKDSLTIGRADVGTALVAAQSVQNYLVWLIAQDVEVGFTGQGFPSQYAWLDTLAHIDIKSGPASSEQSKAFENLKTLFPATGTTSSRNFLGIRSGYQTKVSAIPGKIIQMANTMKEVADYAHTYQTSLKTGLMRMDADQNKVAHQLADSLVRMLSSPTTITKGEEYRQEYAGYTMVRTVNGGYNYVSKFQSVYYPGFSVKVDLAKIITLGSRQVFLPRFAWNSESQWAAKGPFDLLKGSSSTSMLDLKDIQVKSPLGLDAYVEWADPTFGGIFPDFKSTRDVLAKIEETNPKGTVVSPSASFLPLQAGL